MPRGVNRAKSVTIGLSGVSTVEYDPLPVALETMREARETKPARTHRGQSPRQGREPQRWPAIPLVIKLSMTAYMIVFVPTVVYNYGWRNLLYFCDVALILTYAGIAFDSALCISTAAVGILVPQLFWAADFALKAVTDRSVFGLADYMFDPRLPLALRFVSSFHWFLPLIQIFLLSKFTGYDRRALCTWTVLASIVVLASYAVSPPPPARDAFTPTNINYVYGPSIEERQTFTSERAWVLVVLMAGPMVVYLPTHIIALRAFPPSASLSDVVRGKRLLIERRLRC